jgi:hypothetical protein
MPITQAERRFIDEVSLELPWGRLVSLQANPRARGSSAWRNGRTSIVMVGEGPP